MPAMGIPHFNQLYPPFDKPEARWALLSVVDQAEAMTAVGGADLRNWMDGIGLFSHRTPLANDAGIEILRGFADSPLEGSGFEPPVPHAPDAFDASSCSAC